VKHLAHLATLVEVSPLARASSSPHPGHTFALKYSVIVEADGASPDQVTAARTAYLAELGRQLGDKDTVLICFRAWARGVEQGIDSLTQAEDLDSGAWIRAMHNAEAAARIQLSGVAKPTFTFLLKV